MKIKRSGLVLLLLLLASTATLAQGLPVAAPEAVGVSSERLERLTRLLEESVENKDVAGAVALVMRKGRIVYLEAVGQADREAGRPMTTDAIFRIASMSKAVTSVAALMLYEEGRLPLGAPVADFIPAFTEMKVLVPSQDEGADPPYELVPAERQITIHDLFTHRSGLTYGFMGRPFLTEMYHEAGISDGLSQTEGTLEEGVDRLAALPLYVQPGTEVEYSLSADVLGRIVEVASGMPLDQFMKKRIFEPLGMDDTFFYLPEDRRDRLAALYEPLEGGGIVRTGEEPITMGSVVYSGSYHYDGPTTYFSGGAGLLSTAEDYARFLQMLVDDGAAGEHRLLSRKTVELMSANHIPPDVEFPPGQGFGLGIAVAGDQGQSKSIASPGELSWGGFFGTNYFADPSEELVAVLMTQRFPNQGVRLREVFRVVVYQSIAD